MGGDLDVSVTQTARWTNDGHECRNKCSGNDVIQANSGDSGNKFMVAACQ